MNSLSLLCKNGCIVVVRDLPCFVTKIFGKSTLDGISEGYSLKMQTNINCKICVIINFDIIVLRLLKNGFHRQDKISYRQDRIFHKKDNSLTNKMFQRDDISL